MKSALYFCAFLSVSFIAACGGERPTEKNTASKAINKAQTITSATPEPTAVATAANSNTQNAAPGNPLTTVRNKQLDRIRQAGVDPNAPKPDIEAILKQSTRPAPENSEFSFALTDIVFERRTFLNHPVLTKVEKVTAGDDKKIKVFTKDGRSIDLPGDAIKSLSTASTASILKAAGLETMGQRSGASKN